MLLKTLEKKTSKLLKVKLDYRIIKNHIIKYENGKYITYLKKLGKLWGISLKTQLRKELNDCEKEKDFFKMIY